MLKTTKSILQIKLDFISDWIKENHHADVMQLDLVDAYEEKFKVKVDVMNYGANRCKDLGKTLSVGYKMGIFKRNSVGLTNGAWNVGFPKWVYVYQLNNKNYDSK